MKHFVYEDEIDRIKLEDGEWVDIKHCMSYGDTQKLSSHFLKLRTRLESLEPNVDVDMDVETGNIALLVINIKAWSLKDREDKVMPINMETIAMLDKVTSERLLSEIDKRNPVPKVAKSTTRSGRRYKRKAR